jgi:hypothetical protein
MTRLSDAGSLGLALLVRQKEPPTPRRGMAALIKEKRQPPLHLIRKHDIGTKDFGHSSCCVTPGLLLLSL